MCAPTQSAPPTRSTWLALVVALLLLPLAGGDCLSDSVSGVVDQAVVASVIVGPEEHDDFCPVGICQVWDVSLIPQLRANGFTGSLIQFYKSKNADELREYMQVAEAHRFWVMPTVRPEYLDNNGERLRELAQAGAGFSNLWGWLCEQRSGFLDDAELMALIRDIVGQDNVVMLMNPIQVDESISHRYSRLWWPKTRSDPDEGETPVYSRARPEHYSTFPVRQLQAIVKPPNTFEVFLQAYGIHRPEDASLPSHHYYIPPNTEDAVYWALVARQAGARAVWWYTLSVVDAAGNHLPMWEAKPDIWDAVCRATDFVRTGEVPMVEWTGRYFVLE